MALVHQLAAAGSGSSVLRHAGAGAAPPPAQHAVEPTIQPDGHPAGELRPSVELEFRNRNDERRLRLLSIADRAAKAAPRHLQRPETVDDRDIDAASDRCPGLPSHLIEP